MPASASAGLPRYRRNGETGRAGAGQVLGPSPCAKATIPQSGDGIVNFPCDMRITRARGAHDRHDRRQA